MKEEKLIQKWLDGELSPEEKRELEQFDAFKDYQKIDAAAQYFKAPKFDADTTYTNIQAQKEKENTRTNWLANISKIAAVLIIGFLAYTFLFQDSLTEVSTQIATSENISLPDNSQVNVNAASYFAFNENQWKQKREVQLKGEAYFKVAKGEKFTVVTPLGNVSVKGTQFNVKQRNNIFVVSCYEGLVEVTTAKDTILLPAGKEYRKINGSSLVESISAQTPAWIAGESNFTSTPLKEVFNELERQYNIKVHLKNLTFGADRTFTGSFVHNNLQQALKAITIPFNLTYKIEGSSVSIIKSE